MNTPSVHIGKVESLIVWIRRELRVRDHLALFSALRDARKIIPLYIMDEGFHASPPAKKKVLLDGLTDLRSSLRNLGGDLIIRSGDPAAVLHHALRDITGNIHCRQGQTIMDVIGDERTFLPLTSVNIHFENNIDCTRPFVAVNKRKIKSISAQTRDI